LKFSLTILNLMYCCELGHTLCFSQFSIWPTLYLLASWIVFAVWTFVLFCYIRFILTTLWPATQPACDPSFRVQQLHGLGYLLFFYPARAMHVHKCVLPTDYSYKEDAIHMAW